jgi:hypothetical protein
MSEGGYDWEPLNSPSSSSSLKKSTHYGCSVDDVNARARAIKWSRRSLNAKPPDSWRDWVLKWPASVGPESRRPGF